MRTVEVIPKQIIILTEFSVEELLLLKRGLDHTELNLNLKNPADKEVSDFMTDTLYKYVVSLLDEIGIKDD